MQMIRMLLCLFWTVSRPLFKNCRFGYESCGVVDDFEGCLGKAIYGSKAANGVIVIETKKIPNLHCTNFVQRKCGIQAPDLSSYNLTNAAEKLEIEKDAGIVLR